MNRDLFFAILSMDSYNRGYGRSIKFSPDESAAPRSETGARIGSATVFDSKGDLAAIAAGFYAIAYQLGGVGGETVIAYRGSDGELR
jgi:hypothetical protein